MSIKLNVNQSKTITERNLKDGIMFAIQKINDLEITSPLRYLELSIFFKEVTEKQNCLDSIVYLIERNHISAIVKQKLKERNKMKQFEKKFKIIRPSNDLQGHSKSVNHMFWLIIHIKIFRINTACIKRNIL